MLSAVSTCVILHKLSAEIMCYVQTIAMQLCKISIYVSSRLSLVTILLERAFCREQSSRNLPPGLTIADLDVETAYTQLKVLDRQHI